MKALNMSVRNLLAFLFYSDLARNLLLKDVE